MHPPAKRAARESSRSVNTVLKAPRYRAADWSALFAEAFTDIVVWTSQLLNGQQLGRITQTNRFLLKLLTRNDSPCVIAMERLWAREIIFAFYLDQYILPLYMDYYNVPEDDLSDKSVVKRVWKRLPIEACLRIDAAETARRPVPAGAFWDMAARGLNNFIVAPAQRGSCSRLASFVDEYTRYGVKYFTSPPPQQLRFGWDDVVYHCDVFLDDELVLATQPIELDTSGNANVSGEYSFWLEVDVQDLLHSYVQGEREHRLPLVNDSRPWHDHKDEPQCRRVRVVLTARRRGGTGTGLVLSDVSFDDFHCFERMENGEWSGCCNAPCLFPLEQDAQCALGLCNYQEYHVKPDNNTYLNNDEFFGNLHTGAMCKVLLSTLRFCFRSQHVNYDEVLNKAEHQLNWLQLFHRFL